ncbi:MAG: TM1802 family CRISPR-associated protein [Candidatus Helarchaeota archaeon]
MNNNEEKQNANTEIKEEQENSRELYASNIERYFEKYKDFFPNIQAKAVFLIGALAGFLLEVQRIAKKDVKIEPFWRSLHGLKMDSRSIKMLYPKIIDKLKMYSRAYSSLVSVISQYVQEAGTFNALDKIEISWYFTHGLSSYQYLKIEKSKNQKGNKG